ncbi:MAG: hypothetical protein ACTSQE_17410 [Candidatus Heimdallarchaeaceae archaeon]
MKKGNVAYKVVELYTRLGTNLAIYRKYASSRSEILDLVRFYPRLFPRYQKGKILEADRRTNGFFVFESKFYAEDFIYVEGLSNVKIIRVKLLDVPRLPKVIINNCGANPKNICRVVKNQMLGLKLRPAPAGCWVCHKIEVLD